MGLFSRSKPASQSGRRKNSRAPASSDAQAGDLRGRARRRLVGALVLVVAAVVILPMLFDKSGNTGKVPVVAQVVIPPAPKANSAQPPIDDAITQPPLAAAQPVQPAAPASGESAHAASPKPEAKPAQSQAKPDQSSDSAQAGKHGASQASPKQQDKPAAKPGKVKRTDDGSVALALLQGRSPDQAKSPPAADADQGKYVLQIAAYTTDKDAKARRDRLVAAGVTNAYVEPAVSSGKQTYRLRVGPFPTRDAAQAAQARLRALGYDNGFISTK